MQSIATFYCLPEGQSYADDAKLSTVKQGTVMISKKDKARKAAEKACRQATLKACGYSALMNKHRKSLRPELPDLKVKGGPR